jgi:hypothetical protein
MVTLLCSAESIASPTIQRCRRLARSTRSNCRCDLCYHPFVVTLRDRTAKAPGDHCGDFVRWYKRAPHSAIGFVTERRAVYEAERSGRISACDLASAIQAVMNCNCGLRRRAMVRRLLVGWAHYILGPFEPDSELRRWGLRLAERGGKTAKKRAVVAVARKLGGRVGWCGQAEATTLALTERWPSHGEWRTSPPPPAHDFDEVPPVYGRETFWCEKRGLTPRAAERQSSPRLRALGSDPICTPCTCRSRRCGQSSSRSASWRQRWVR